jgi:hypothetical protein
MKGPTVRFLLRLSSGRTIELTAGKQIDASDLHDPGTLTPDKLFAEVDRNPRDHNVIGLKNLSSYSWNCILPAGQPVRVDSGRTVRLADGTRIDFGPLVAAVKSNHGAFALALPSGASVALPPGTKLSLGDLSGTQGSRILAAEVTPNPKDPSILGLKNLSAHPWSAMTIDGSRHQIDPGRSIKLAAGTKLDLAGVHAEIATVTALNLPVSSKILTGAAGVIVLAVVIWMVSRSASNVSSVSPQTGGMSVSSSAVSSEPAKDTWGEQPNGPPDITTQWDKSFATPQYLLHVPASDTDTDYYFLSAAPANANGEIQTPLADGTTATQKTDQSKGPFNSPRALCQAAAGVSMGPLSPADSSGSFDCATMPNRG